MKRRGTWVGITTVALAALVLWSQKRPVPPPEIGEELAPLVALLGGSLAPLRPDPPLGDPRELLGQGGQRRYSVTRDEMSYEEVHTLERDGQTWLHEVGENDSLGYVVREDGSVALAWEEDSRRGVITRYDPPRLWLRPGMSRGVTERERVEVRVVDRENPERELHTGYLDVTVRQLGSHRVTVPEGTHDGVVVRWEYSGRIGPAEVEDVQLECLVPGLGTVASVELRSVSAFFVYRESSRTGKRLIAAP